MNFNATLIGQMFAFAVFVWFCMKFVWPFVIKALEERKKTIADGLAAAEKGQHELELAEHRATEILKEGKEKSQEYINQAQKRADEIVEEAKESAKVEGDRIIANAIRHRADLLARAVVPRDRSVRHQPGHAAPAVRG